MLELCTCQHLCPYAIRDPRYGNLATHSISIPSLDPCLEVFCVIYSNVLVDMVESVSCPSSDLQYMCIPLCVGVKSQHDVIEAHCYGADKGREDIAGQ